MERPIAEKRIIPRKEDTNIFLLVNLTLSRKGCSIYFQVKYAKINGSIHKANI
jgi:hypothetical protein